MFALKDVGGFIKTQTHINKGKGFISMWVFAYNFSELSD